MDHSEEISFRAKIGLAFQPGTPIDSLDLFSGRREQTKDIINAVFQKGQHAIIFGEPGVGKTSLVRVLAEILSFENLQFLSSGTINCDRQDTFDSLWGKVFRELKFNLTKLEAGFGSGEKQFEISMEGARTQQPDDIRHGLDLIGREIIIIIDELDRLKNESENTSALLADTIKNLSDHATKVTIILVGVGSSVDQLVSEHKSIERCLVQVPMPRMSNDELVSILDTGMQKCGMEMKDEAKEYISKLSQGLPHFTHLLGQYSAYEALERQRASVDVEDVHHAIRNAVQKSHSLLSVHTRAVSSPQKNIYKEVLTACALTETDPLGYFPASAVSGPLSEITGKNYYIPAFARHLNDFCLDKRGSVLQKTGAPRSYRYRFVNPLMRPFTVLHGLSTNLLNDEIIYKSKQSEDTV